jgi:GT2 family glycosyltransferase
MRITAIVPNYNGQEGLKILLPQLCGMDFSGIYVLDDGSVDQSVAFAKSWPKVRVIEADRNLGPSGNRNRILSVHDLGDMLWFIDADMEMVTVNVEEIVERLFKDPSVALVGGFILNRKGTPYYWNYGYEKHPVRDRMARFYGYMGKKYEHNKKIWNFLRKRAIRYFFGMEIDAGNHQERVVEWVAEGSFLVRTDIFRRISGFDERMRYHEAHDLCKRIRELGFLVKFSPEIVTRHLEIDCRGGGKTRDWMNGEKYFYEKHWGTLKGCLKNFFRIGNFT